MHDADVATEVPDLGREQTGAGPLYKGDLGTLPAEARRALVQLLRGPAIDGRHHGLLWAALQQHENAIRCRLADLFLDLVIDRASEVAFTQQADTGELESPNLLQRQTLTFIQSVILIELRTMLAAADARGERATVSEEELVDKVLVFDTAEGTDRVKFRKRVEKAITSIREKGFLRKIRNSADRFEISPTLKLLFSIEQVQAMMEAYRNLDRTQLAEEDGAEEEGDSNG